MFTPIETTIGALLLHQASSNLLYQNGNILGASGFLRQLLSTPTREHFAFFAGMAASYIPLKAIAPQLITSYPAVQIASPASLATVAIAALIGWGTKMSNGCTSGHMLCGLSRLSGRSVVAVASFFPTAIITHHLAHPDLFTSACLGNVPCYTPVYPTPEAIVSLCLLAASSIFAAQTVPNIIAQMTDSNMTKYMKEPPDEPYAAARITTQFFSGFLFALGLHISQMSHPAKVASFLSFPVLERWDPSLALVIVFGVLPNLIENRIKGFDHPPLFADKFALPTKTIRDIDVRFLMGAMAFGVGWGLTGTCPGPAVLRAFAQPMWGLSWIGGFWLGGRLGSL
ncbi:transporter component [Pyrenophora tritici-repentis]|uniref:Transporter component n=2 Tax=Pyrenophora tritici-repentis TaxID=45151 RepID=A0A2W1CW79_9PLEO|nr:YeeE/YedE family integral membrane protein [Pyrenophora tritici-repentis Pt-1C-BFP]KAA8618804.1 hypothetical protein PtrV1_08233 [Pyrenophora tritici-repentis]EDU48650.1 YeeE/YedE family integral membrane protein [Pyrenophora tritici-repentis Pt-1C-BFP]KAF7449274.1 hypothetical protein A1F99_063230 [Pyrenophora tritici-repentis]KAF7570718.1 transporter component [Pyrenophora tritici-repentis]KAG9383785.1 hypothetical protein A1F94_005696 [Pyrenophora tritici-repentis]